MLVEAAKSAMMKAYAPYSNFFVGAALLCRDGKVYSGANVENSSYGVTSCAERTALFSAVFDGERDFEAIAIVGGKGGEITDFCAPCGICRQALCEFCSPDMNIYLYDGKEIKQFTLGELLPQGFRFDLLKN